MDEDVPAGAAPVSLDRVDEPVDTKRTESHEIIPTKCTLPHKIYQNQF